MLVILEGVNGTGKSTVARRLVRDFGYTRFKPFRPPGDSGHWTDEEGADLRAHLDDLQVPANGHVEDIFSADFLRQFPALSVVLDRSLPSAFAYDSVPRSVDWGTLLDTWTSLLESLKPIYIHMTAEHMVIRHRTGDRAPLLSRYTAMEEQFAWAMARMPWPTHTIDTTSLTSADTWQRVRKTMRRSAP